MCSRFEPLRDGPLALSQLRWAPWASLPGYWGPSVGRDFGRVTLLPLGLFCVYAWLPAWMDTWVMGFPGFYTVVGPLRSGDSCTGVDVLPYGPPPWPRDVRAITGRPREWLKPVCSTSGPPPITASGAGCLFYPRSNPPFSLSFLASFLSLAGEWLQLPSLSALPISSSPTMWRYVLDGARMTGGPYVPVACCVCRLFCAHCTG